ncbi:MAG: 16S rRNA (guanine(966)-N(2))-methyltransferase RsmD [Candidatus Limnocylindrales bacterium]
MPEAGRVIAGTARGRRLLHPGPGTRPYSDRVKQTIFGTLQPALAGARVLDLFAGSGGGGIEALSRGAASCDFVERDASAARVIEENLRRTGLDGPRARVHHAEAVAFLARASGPYDVVLLDPPFGDAAILVSLERLGTGALLAPDAVVVARHFWRDELPEWAGRLRRRRTRRVGEGMVAIYRLERATDADAETA